MKIINDQTPTSEVTAIKIGDQISNGLGTFGEVEDITFEDTNEYWHFRFTLVGGGYIESKKERTSC
jgi:hypothetical protein